MSVVLLVYGRRNCLNLICEKIRRFFDGAPLTVEGLVVDMMAYNLTMMVKLMNICGYDGLQ